MIERVARKFSRFTQGDQSELFRDLMQEAALAELIGKDPVDAIRQHWKYLEGGRKGHVRLPVRPVFFEHQEFNVVVSSPEQLVVDRDLLMKIYQRVGPESRAVMRANYTGSPCVWRPERKLELKKAAVELRKES